MASAATRTKRPIVEQEPRATIYVRNYAKKAIMLILPTKIGMRELRQKIQRKMKVAHEDQALFLHGTLIPNEIEQLTLENKLIFHLVNLKRINLEKIVVSVKRIQPNSHVYKYNVYPQMQINQFVSNQFARDFSPVENFFLVYTGRQLQPSNTFLEEYVEDQSEILAIHKVQNLKSEFIELRRLNADQLGWRAKNQKKTLGNGRNTKMQEIQQKYSEKTHEDQDRLKNARSEESSQHVSKPESQIQEKEQSDRDFVDGKEVKNGKESEQNRQLETKEQYNENIIRIEGEEHATEIQKQEGKITVLVPVQSENQQQNKDKKEENKSEKNRAEQNKQQVKQSKINVQVAEDVEDDEEETEEIVIGKAQKYSMVSSSIKGPQNENPRRLRSMNSAPKVEKEQQNVDQNQNDSESHNRDGKSAGNMGLTVISSRHDEEQSITGSEFKPIQRLRIQRDGLDVSQNQQVCTINRTESANIVLDEDDTSRKEDKSQPVVAEDSQESENKDLDQMIQNILNGQGQDESSNKNTDEGQKKYQISLYDVMNGDIPPKSHDQGNDIEGNEVIIVTETNEEKAQGQKENVEPEMNYQTDSKQSKPLEIIAQDEAVPQEDEEKVPEANAENLSESQNVNKKIPERAQKNVLQEKESEQQKQLKNSKKRSRNSEEYVRIMEERIGRNDKSQQKTVFMQDEPVQITDLKQEDRPVEFLNVFNPHYLQNEEAKNAPVENRQQPIAVIPSYLHEGDTIAIPEVHVENLESNITQRFPPKKQKLENEQYTRQEGLKQNEKGKQEQIMNLKIGEIVDENEKKQSSVEGLERGMILLANEYSLGMESIQDEILEEYQKYLQ